jgi:hypothetical protein
MEQSLTGFLISRKLEKVMNYPAAEQRGINPCPPGGFKYY